MTSWRSFVRTGIVLLVLLVLWEVGVKLANTPAWLVPAPTKIFQTLWIEFPKLTKDIMATLQLALLGFGIGCSVGFLLASILHQNKTLEQIIYPLVILSQNIPIIVLAPLLIIWFGFGMLPKLIVIGLVCFFPVAVATLDGLKQTAPELKHYMAMVGATKQQMFWKLELPHSLPSLFSGLKIAATYSVMGAVISEWLGAKDGIGIYMTLAQSSFRTDRVFVAIIVIMVLSLLFFAVLRFVEQLCTKGRSRGEAQ